MARIVQAANPRRVAAPILGKQTMKTTSRPLTGEEFQAAERTKREIERLRSGSFAARLFEHAKGVHPLPFEGVSSQLAAEMQSCCDGANLLQSQADADLTRIAELLANADEDTDFSALALQVENSRLDKLQSAQRNVNQWKLSLDLAKRQVVELEPIPSRMESKLEEVVVEVTRKLTEIGNGIESMPAYGLNQNSAEVQFAHLSRRQNVRSRAALAAVENAKAAYNGSVLQVRRIEAGLAGAQKFIREVATEQLRR
jgi:hypothetical protein